MDPKKPTSSLLGKRKRESETAALNAIEKAPGTSSNSSSVGAPVAAPVGANSGIVPGQSASTNLASSSTTGPITTSSAEDQTSSNKSQRIDKDNKTSSTVPYIISWSPVSQQKATAQKVKRKYKKIKRRTRHKQSIARTQEQGAQSTSSTVRKRTASSSSDDEPTNKKKHRGIEKKAIKKRRKRSKKTKKPTRHRKISQPSTSTQQQSDLEALLDAFAKAFVISTSAANTSVVTSQTSAPPTMTVAKDTNAIPSTSSAANTSVVTSQTSAPPTIIVAKDTNAIPSTSSLVMKKGGFEQHNANNTGNVVESSK
ncbi:unnamed protein product [Protopolystoma xenopodis]|uniref:Uncharacterized protein n=1 Tax=Protopolystoma xenopodis TaxID=117903 RepID=A0A448X6D0_9PLAT|nr:unnamed protein product [Protopolystoma xenopodis]